MDELKIAWQELKESSHDFNASTESALHDSIRAKSKGPIEKIKKQVFIKLFMCLIFIGVFSIYLPFANPFISQVLIVFIITGYAIGSILLYQEYNNLKNNLDMSQDLLKGLKSYKDKIIQITRYEEIIGFILYPISGPAGFFVGIKLQNPGAPILEDHFQWIALVLIIVILTPIGHFITRSMNRLIFGKHLKIIDENISVLESQ